ncbi:hypothetical protein [Phenylobacterium sp.]|uniref:hypothetical protein n=1 Tax=Phenylobacterium sp. TaxID=1871053 RepID=UPI001219C101|nr:hypothetical protein [Phenylobacterium sp.]THD52152.1 MAG: hypothetical protein E8A12_20225 [Phenylobacterium sp.]
MTAIAAGAERRRGRPFAPFHRSDRSFFLVITLLMWGGIVTGFGSDVIHHISAHEPAFPLIVHFHAAAFVGWMVLFTAQMALIRTGRQELHRKVGVGAIGLAAVMVVLGPATAITMDSLKFAADHQPPAFLAVQFSDIAAFVVLLTAGLVWRRSPAAHKRLVLLATLYITDAGFARALGGPVHAALGDGYWATWLGLYTGNDLLILGFGGYDLATRGRLHPAYVAGSAFILAVQFTAAWLLTMSPAWAQFSLHLIGR